jgi:two-component system response regulator HydG
MRELYRMLERIAQSQAPVLVRGESGVGKELVARALHFEGPRRAAAFVAVNCTALPESLLESELFGHVRGAFTGATTARRGLFLEADGGTLLLDEIGDMPPPLQAKLLRVLEEGEIRPVGSDIVRKVDVRLVAATHQDLEERVRAGSFRQDLYYRLNVVPVQVPALRDRCEDVPLLAEHFLAQARARNPASVVRSFEPAALATLARWSWPGNARELENLIERLVIIGFDEIVEAADIKALLPSAGDTPLDEAKRTMVPLKQLEREYITWVVAQCGGNKTRAAELLGIDVSTIHRRERGTH